MHAKKRERERQQRVAKDDTTSPRQNRRTFCRRRVPRRRSLEEEEEEERVSLSLSLSLSVCVCVCVSFFVMLNSFLSLNSSAEVKRGLDRHITHRSRPEITRV